jgi:hypothetical protein
MISSVAYALLQLPLCMHVFALLLCFVHLEVSNGTQLARPFGKFGHFGISGNCNPYIRPPDPPRGSCLTIILLHSSTRISLTASLLNLDIAAQLPVLELGFASV